MNRCQPARAPALGMRARLALAALLSFGLLGAVTPRAALAQETVKRDAPKDVVLGQMTVVLPPVIQIDGKDDRLSPGARIRDLRNLAVLSGSLAGKTVPVVYKRDSAGLVHEVWLLTADEYARLSGTTREAQKFLDTLALVFGARR